MALTFPTTPSDGQIFTDTATGNRYIYVSASGLWKFASNSVGMSVSSTPPANVAPGAMWFNREIGRTFVYYDDGDSKQWIETVPATGSFDSSAVASYANAAAVLAVGAAYNTANAGFGKANNALANTSGVTFAGDLNVTGNVGIGVTTANTSLDVSGKKDGIVLPTGTTAERSSSPKAGTIRFNTTTGNPEWYDTTNSTWQPFSFSSTAYDVDYLVVAGGGGGASGWVNGNATAGGGAGGYRASVTKVISGSSYTVIVGNGGTGAQVTSSIGADGSNSSFGSITSIGGGGGVLGSTPARNGGSGGGSGVGSLSGGLGTSGQGFDGGVGDNTVKYRGGGGGGASAVGATGNASGNGGAGLTWLNGTTYAGGGGGGIYRGDIGGGAGSGGSGGGGAGGSSTFTTASAGTNGTTNTGGGGGGGGSGGSSGWGVGGNGASGIVIVRYSGQPRGSGGTISQSSGYTYHTFTANGTFTA